MTKFNQTVYAIIPVHNRCEYTRACLACFQKQTYPKLEVIVVDDGSSDGTSEMIQENYPSTVIVQGTGNLWWLGGVNAGLDYVFKHASDDDLVLLMNNDLQFDEDLVSTLYKAWAAQPKSVIAAVESLISEPNVIVDGGPLTNWWIAKGRVLNKGRRLDEFPTMHLEPVDWVTGRGVLFPLEVFKSLGVYEKRFVHCGDTEMGVRAKNAGYETYYCYDAVVYSYDCEDRGINRTCYKWRDLKAYFFDERSYANLKNIFWLSVLCTKNPIQGVSYFLFSLLRVSFRFLRHLER